MRNPSSVNLPQDGSTPRELARTGRWLWVLLTSLLALMVIGVSYYFFVEPVISGRAWSFTDAIYQTILVVTTIGFTEAQPLSQTGRLFTTGFAVASLLVLALIIRLAAGLLVSQQLSAEVQRRRRLRIVNEMRGHYIVCGYGRMGREAVHQLRRRGIPVVVVEQNPAKFEPLREAGLPYVEGNATLDEHLRAAGVERAKCLIAAAGTDEDNLFIVLSARLLNPNLYIVARAGRDESIDKFQRAGANSVHSPYVLGGRDLATAAVEPGVVHFLEQVMHEEQFDVDFRSVAVPSGSAVVGHPMLGSGIMREDGAMILAVLSADKTLRTNPRPDTKVQPGDTIIAMGTKEQLAKLQGVVAR
jgi:voltage-gated potassium channel